MHLPPGTSRATPLMRVAAPWESSGYLTRWRAVPESRRRTIGTVAALAVFALLTLGYFNPILRTDSTFSLVAGHSSIQFPWAAHPSHYHDGAQSDQANNVYPIQSDLSRNLRDGTFPYWSNYSFGGGPTLGTVYGVGFYPPRVLASLILSPSWVHDLLIMFHVWLAGAVMYLLVRRLGASWIAALLAGVAWMFSPSWFGLALLEGDAILAALLPLSLWLVHRAVIGRSMRDAVGVGSVLALIVLGASVQPAAFCFAIAGLWGLLLGVMGPQRDRARDRRDVLVGNLAIVAAYTVLGVALCAFLVLPATMQISASGRAAVPDATMKLQNVGLDSFSHVLDPSPPLITGDSVWTLTFLGLPVVVAGLAGFFSRRAGAGLGRSLVVVFFLLMAGTVLTEIARVVVPGFSYISPLGRLLPFFAFGAILLAGIGIDALRNSARRWLKPHIAVTAVTAIAVLAVPLEAGQLIPYDRDVNPPFQPRTASLLYPQTPLIHALQQSRGREAAAGDEQRILAVRPGRPTGPFTPPPFVGETPRLVGLENAGGYLNVIPERSRILTLVLAGMTAQAAVRPLVGAYDAFFYSSTARFDLLQRMGVDAVITPPNPTYDAGFRQAIRTANGKITYSGSDGAVISVPSTRRAFVVDGVAIASDTRAALARYSDPSFDLRRTVLLDGQNAAGVASQAGSGPVQARTRILPTDQSERRIEVDSPRAGWLVMLDSYSEGWSAKVNGAKTTVKRADFAYRAVHVPAGHSIVMMQYRTPGLRAGVAVSLLGLLVALGLLAHPRMLMKRWLGPRKRAPHS